MKKKRNIHYIIDAVRAGHAANKAMVPASIFSALFGAVIPFIAIWISAYVLDALVAGIPFQEILLPALLGVAAAFALKLIETRLEKTLHANLMAAYYQFRNLQGTKTIDMDYPMLEEPEVTKLRERIRTDSQWGSGIANTYFYLGEIVKAIATLVLSVVTLYPVLANSALYQSWNTLLFLALAALLTVGAILFTNKVMDPALQKFMYNLTPTFNTSIRKYIYGSDYLKLGKDIRIFDGLPLVRGGMADPQYKKNMRREIRHYSRINGMGDGLRGLAEGLIQGGAYLLVTLLALGGSLSIGTVVRCAAGLYQLTQGISSLFTEYSSFGLDTKRLQSTFEYQKLPDVLYKGTIPVEKRRDNEYRIEFHDVSFRYPGSEQWALKHLNMQFRIGEKLAVVGQNGSGKTTMIKLLCRLYDPTEGSITLNGVDIRKYDYQEYMDIFSVVFQDFQLFSFTLGQNVAASAEYDEARAKDALIQAGFGERLEELPLNTLLYKNYDDTGVEVSGGEAQKIALARALYKNAPFIILDEPTAALDPIAEYEIYSRFNDIVGDRTAVYISHRLSSCRFCQNIAVFDEGRLVQRGSHQDLLTEQGGKYHALWTAQAQYYTDQGDAAMRRIYE